MIEHTQEGVSCRRCKVNKAANQFRTFPTGRLAKTCLRCCEKERVYRNQPLQKAKKKAINKSYYDRAVKYNIKASPGMSERIHCPKCDCNVSAPYFQMHRAQFCVGDWGRT